MTDRDRLIELMSHKQQYGIATEEPPEAIYTIENHQVADYLLANGVIVPPCKVGDKVYLVGVFTGQIIETKVIGIAYNESGIYLLLENFTVTSVAEQLGKTVFLTKEEAEAKLEKRGKENAR